ncbi:MAG TPA: AAA family ATPase [Chthoniobacteraceae bacterium]|jgi:MoxR-like ATPase|nr:ATPase associated with various cellular 3 [Chthoniobacter sp.]HEV7867039.1 AAA family ATPase [Chthoniobacteraceae bacterium]
MHNQTTAAAPEADVLAIDELRALNQRICAELRKVIIGQDEVIEKLLICIFARGHGLLMGVPGLAKTLLVHSLADLMSLNFNRVQFTPDLMPSDITGTEILQETDQPGRRAFEFVKGPIFANIVLADEINRTPPKTQAALLQAMQEQKVNSGKHSFTLDSPFFVLATQNPIEQEGTYPLPEAQLDRFMFLINVGYPSAAEELQIAKATTGGAMPTLNKLLSGPDILRFQDVVRRVPVPDHVYEYVVQLVRRCRPGGDESPDWVKKWVMWGPGPRAVQYLVLGAKARATLQGSYIVRLEDVHAVAEPVLAHRILVNFHAESEGVGSIEIIRRIIAETAE